MPQKLIEKLEKSGRLKKQRAGISQVESLRHESAIDISKAEKICHISQRATYLLAYNAMLKAGRALLLFHGYRPVDGAQHKTVVEVTTLFLGRNYQNLTNHFESMRRKRNEMTYETGGLLTKSETRKAFSDAKKLVKEILSNIKNHNPQIELKF